MVRKLIILTLLSVFLLTTKGVFAEDVFMTQKGKKYHKENCRWIKKKANLKSLEKEIALEKSYLPCKRCFKEDVVIEEKEELKPLLENNQK